jgi:hypothetical protein
MAKTCKNGTRPAADPAGYCTHCNDVGAVLPPGGRAGDSVPCPVCVVPCYRCGSPHGPRPAYGEPCFECGPWGE